MLKGHVRKKNANERYRNGLGKINERTKAIFSARETKEEAGEGIDVSVVLKSPSDRLCVGQFTPFAPIVRVIR